MTLKRIASSFRGQIELWFGAGFLCLAIAGGLSVDNLEWTTVAAGVLLLAATHWALSSGIRSAGMTACIISGLFITDTETAAFVALLSFLVLEVQILHAHWRAAEITSLAIGLWFIFGSPLAPWQFSDFGQALVGALGISLAVSVGLGRRLSRIQKRQAALDHRLLQKNLQIDLARRLHDSVADSLTRIVLLSPEQPDIQREARQGIRSLREVIAQLRIAAPENADEHGLKDCLDVALGELKKLGLEPELEIEGNLDVIISSESERALREAFTNVLKHGAKPVRVFIETDASKVNAFIVNGIRSESRLPMDTTGMGLASIERLAQEAGGSAQFTHKNQTARVALELPIVTKTVTGRVAE